MACVVLLCGAVLAALLFGIAVYCRYSWHFGGISLVRLLVLGAFGLWAAAYLGVFAVGLFRGEQLVAMSEEDSTTKMRGVRSLTIAFYGLVVIAGAVFWDAFSPHFPTLLGLILFVVVTGYLLVAVHECGHLISARLLGLRPILMKIGIGREMASFPWRGMRVSVGLNFFSGYLQVVNNSGAWTRSKSLMLALGGPVASLVTFAGVVSLVFLLDMKEPLWGVISPVLLLSIFAGQNLAMICGFFGPEVTIDGMRIKSDMTVIFGCLFGSEGDWKMQGHDHSVIMELVHQGEAKSVWNLTESRWTPEPQFAGSFMWFAGQLDNEQTPAIEQLVNDALMAGQANAEQRAMLLFARGLCLARQGQVERGSASLAEAIEAAPTDDLKIDFCEQVANLVLASRLLDFLPAADRYSTLALETRPHEITLKGTRGSILIEIGRVEDGAVMLEEVFDTTKSGHDKTICAFYLALAARKRDRESAVQEWHGKMMQYNPPKWLQDRVGELDVQGET